MAYWKGSLHLPLLLQLISGVFLCQDGVVAQGLMRKNPMRRYGAGAQQGLRPGRLGHARLGMSAAGGWQGPVIKDQFTVQMVNIMSSVYHHITYRLHMLARFDTC
eukprot:1137935-Pelagomonas_calceolata.AAC.1